MATAIEKLDAQIASLFAEWGLVTTALALLIAVFIVYPVIYPDEPDTHPLLLARQAQPSPVRNKNESAVFRSPETPHGYPLRTGLNVKDDGAPKWATGKDGDIRDVWREVQRGGRTDSAGKIVPKGAIVTVFGKEDVVEHSIDDLSCEIAVIGSTLKAQGVSTVAIYLPNSVEYLLTIFACSFYGLTVVLLPYNQPHPKTFDELNHHGIDALVCAAGNLPLDDLVTACPKLHSLIWVVEKTSRHMDWNGVPEGREKQLTVGVWHDLVDENKTCTATTLADSTPDSKPGDIISVWRSTTTDAKPEYARFSQENAVAAIGALISALPLRSRYTAADMILPINTFSHQYILFQTLAALFSHANLAITSVAEPGVDFTLACRLVSPTVVLASPETLVALHQAETAKATGLFRKIALHSHTRSMSAGRMPSDGLLFKLLAPTSSTAGNTPGRLRLILTSERVHGGTPVLTSAMLADLRIFTRARICYALTCSQVAGAISQTHIFDYRRDDSPGFSHFGVPLSSLEIKLVNTNDAAVAGHSPVGELVVSGPAVSGKETRLGFQVQIRTDGTLAYA